jgi:transcriptional regulator with XRE-family HTH domain
MTTARLKACLKALRWSEADLAEELGSTPATVRAWLDGRDHAPLAVLAWLEALASAHRAVPKPVVR